jgi:hypothetical protein
VVELVFPSRPGIIASTGAVVEVTVVGERVVTVNDLLGGHVGLDIQSLERV